MRIGTKFLASLIIALLMSVQLHATKLDNDIDAVISLGEQISSIRSMLGDYIIIGTKIKFKNPSERLKASIEKYDATLELLNKKYSSDAYIQKILKESQVTWKPIKDKLLQATTIDKETMRKEAQFVHDNIRNIIISMEKIQEHLLKNISSVNSIELKSAIDISTASHLLSAHYMMKMWKLSDPTIITHWDRGIATYQKSIDTLKKSSHYKNVEFKGWLDETESIVEYLIMSFSMIETNASPSIVFNKCETVYEVSNKMVQKIVTTK